MVEMPKTIAVPFKLAVIGLVFCVEPSAELREEIQETVRKALEDLPHVKVDGQYYMWHDATIQLKVKPEATDGQ